METKLDLNISLILTLNDKTIDEKRRQTNNLDLGN